MYTEFHNITVDTALYNQTGYTIVDIGPKEIYLVNDAEIFLLYRILSLELCTYI